METKELKYKKEIEEAILQAKEPKFESVKFPKAGYWWVMNNGKKEIVLVEDNSIFNDFTPNIYPFYSDDANHESNFEPIEFISEAESNKEFSNPEYYMTPKEEKEYASNSYINKKR